MDLTLIQKISLFIVGIVLFAFHVFIPYYANAVAAQRRHKLSTALKQEFGLFWSFSLLARVAFGIILAGAAGVVLVVIYVVLALLAIGVSGIGMRAAYTWEGHREY